MPENLRGGQFCTLISISVVIAVAIVNEAMTVMPTFHSLCSASVTTLSAFSVPWIFIIFSFQLEQGFRECFRFCENIGGTLKVSRGRNKSSHFREPFGFS
jgi:hypothetical protein